MEPRTHLRIDSGLCGTPVEFETGHASVELRATTAMRVDDHGLVHGGFVFGLADYAAMLAVNDPTVVLGSADARFLKPVTVGQEMLARARLTSTDGKKRHVHVEVTVEAKKVFEGEFTCFVLPRHVLAQED